MKKIIIVLTIVLLNILNISAQKITNADDLKNFYIKYLTYNIDLSCEKAQDSLVKESCTKEFYIAWNEDVNEIGLYDPLTNGYFDDIDLMRSSLFVVKDRESYIVSFKHIRTFPEHKVEIERIIVYVNSEGKISHTVRPSDNYWTPTK